MNINPKTAILMFVSGFISLDKSVTNIFKFYLGVNRNVMGTEKGTLTNSSPFLPGTIPGNKEIILCASSSKRRCGPLVRVPLILPSISIINCT